MHKEELIQLHTYMAQMKRYFERNGITHEFDDYKALSISPVHIHRSKADHKRAIFILGGELANLMSRDDFISDGQSVQMRESLNSIIKLMGSN
jgi:hypothetical protein